MVNSPPQPLYPRVRDLVPIVRVAGWAPVPVWSGAEDLAPTGIRSADRPARSESLYQLSYSGPHYPIDRQTTGISAKKNAALVERCYSEFVFCANMQEKVLANATTRSCTICIYRCTKIRSRWVLSRAGRTTGREESLRFRSEDLKERTTCSTQQQR